MVEIWWSCHRGQHEVVHGGNRITFDHKLVRFSRDISTSEVCKQISLAESTNPWKGGNLCNFTAFVRLWKPAEPYSIVVAPVPNEEGLLHYCSVRWNTRIILIDTEPGTDYSLWGPSYYFLAVRELTG